MRGLNRITLIGRLGRHPELRTSKTGTPWCRLAVATNRPARDGDGWKEETDWHRVKVFGSDAERCDRMLRAGSLVSVEGTMTYDHYEDKDGVKRVASQVIARNIGFLTDLREPAA
jgi:single-strand DNA-binding protein